MSQSVIDRTVSQIVAPDGSQATKPTMIIGADAATIMRAYFFWALKHHLEPELYCGNCAANWSRSAKATYNITDSEIQIICECSLRFFQGASLPPDPIAPSVTIPAHDDSVGKMILSDGAARLLRRYKKKVLQGLNLKEALRCNVCYQLSTSDGCDAQILTNSIRIRCRCTDRVYQGSTP